MILFGVFLKYYSSLVDLWHKYIESQNIKWDSTGKEHLKKSGVTDVFRKSWSDNPQKKTVIHSLCWSPTLCAIAGSTADQGPEPQPPAQKGERGRILKKGRLSHPVIHLLCLQCGFISDLDNYYQSCIWERLWLRWRTELEPEGRIEYPSAEG